MVKIHYPRLTATTYWKVGTASETAYSRKTSDRELREQLQSHGYNFTKNSPRSRLEELAMRAQRGLPCYDKDSVANLRRFAKQRGLQSRPGNKKANFVKLLEQADEDREFHRFLDLPAELRLLVYEFYLEPITRIEHVPWNYVSFSTMPVIAPPITSVSRLLRAESLPLFYSMRTVEICLFNGLAITKRPLKLRDGNFLHISKGVEHFRPFRRFHISLSKCVVPGSPNPTDFRWEIVVGGSQDSRTVRVATVNERSKEEKGTPVIAKVDESVEGALREFYERRLDWDNIIDGHDLIGRVPAMVEEVLRKNRVF